jgi:hypothetical protein
MRGPGLPHQDLATITRRTNTSTGGVYFAGQAKRLLPVCPIVEPAEPYDAFQIKSGYGQQQAFTRRLNRPPPGSK